MPRPTRSHGEIKSTAASQYGIQFEFVPGRTSRSRPRGAMEFSHQGTGVGKRGGRNSYRPKSIKLPEQPIGVNPDAKLKDMSTRQVKLARNYYNALNKANIKRVNAYEKARNVADARKEGPLFTRYSQLRTAGQDEAKKAAGEAAKFNHAFMWRTRGADIKQAIKDGGPKSEKLNKISQKRKAKRTVLISKNKK